MDDRKIINDIRAGGAATQAAMSCLYNNNREMLANHIHSKTGCPESEIEDVLQDTFLKVFDYISNDKITINRSLKALLKTSAFHLAIDHYRRNRYRDHQVSIDEENIIRYIEDPSAPNPCEWLIRSSLFECYQRAFNLFYQEHPERGELLIEQKAEGRSIKQLAEKLGKSVSNTTTYISETRKKLKHYKERFCKDQLSDID